MEIPSPPNETERLAALRDYAILDSPPEAAFDRITGLAARLLGVPIALVTLIDRERQWFKSCYGLDLRQTDRKVAFCAHAILAETVLVVPDAREDARFVHNPLVTGPPGIRFYAGAPLRTPEGFNLGTLCVIDTVPRQMGEAERATLADLAALVVDEMQLRQTALKLRAEVAERQRAEAAYVRLAFFPEVDPNPIVEIGLDGAITYHNPAAARTFPELWKQGVRHPLLTGWPSWLAEFETPGKSSLTGEVQIGDTWYQQAITHVPQSRRVRIHSFDISPRKRAEAATRDAVQEVERAREEAERARSEAERASGAKSEFLSRMSHELRTPLNAILGFAQLLEMDELTPPQRNGVDHILKGGQHLLELINEVLDIARIEAGRLSFSVEPVPVHDVLQEALDLIGPLAAGHGVTLHRQTACHAWVLADRQRLKQVLLNLLSNAVKYNRRGGAVTVSGALAQARDGEVVADGEVVEDGGPVRWWLQVQDTGRGMTPAQLGRLFTPFERLGAEQSSVEGTGIGLALSKRLMGLMGGTIAVESVAGQGSTFTVELPLARDGLRATETDSPEEEAQPSPHLPAPQKTVLYIEDNLPNLKLVESILLRRPGIKLVAAMQGSIGLDLALQHRPDLILLDIHLPDLDGAEVLHRLRQHPATADVPVVVISADATPHQMERLRLAGAVGYLTKPLEVPRFLAVLDEQLPVENLR